MSSETPDLSITRVSSPGTNSKKPGIEVDGSYVSLQDVLPEVQPVWQNWKHLALLNCCLIVPLLSSASAGFDASLVNGLQSLSQWHDYFHTPTGAVLGALSNGFTIGMVLGLPVCALLNDRYGRLLGLRSGCTISVIGSALQAGSQDYAMFLVARIIIGFGSVITSVSGILLVSELAFPTHRAVVTATFVSLWYLGAFIAAWTIYGTYDMATSWSWRLPSLLQGLIPLLQLLGSFIVPESPRFLVSAGREDEGLRVLNKHHAGGNPAYDGLVHFEMAEIKSALAQEETARKVTYWAFLETKANRHRLFVVIFLAGASQLAGNGLVSYYLVLVLNSIGITETPRQLTINASLMGYNFATGLFAAFVTAKLPRRLNLLTGIGAMAVCYIVWTVLSGIYEQNSSQQTSLAEGVLAMIFLYYAAYNFAFTLQSLYITELLPYHLRAKGVTIYSVTQGLTLIYNGFVNPVAMEAIGWRYYIVFCCLLIVEFLVVLYTFPETFGYTLEETTQAFERPREA